MTEPGAPPTAELDATLAWSGRVRRVGGFIQVGLRRVLVLRGSLPIDGAVGLGLTAASSFVGCRRRRLRHPGHRRHRLPTRQSRSKAHRASGHHRDHRPAGGIVRRARHRHRRRSHRLGLAVDRLTIGPLLLWLDHEVHIPRYRPVGWALIIGPVLLAATMSGRSAHRHNRHHRRQPPARNRRRRLPRPRGRRTSRFAPAPPNRHAGSVGPRCWPPRMIQSLDR